MNYFRCGFGKMVSSLAVLTGLFAAGCGSSGDGGVQPGVLGVSLTDAPACGFDQVNVTVSKVRVHQSSSATENSAGWSDITLTPPVKINLLDYNDPTQNNFALLTLGETTLPAGHYTQVRLVLVPNNGPADLANSVVLSGETTEIQLDTPSAVQSGIKLVHEFDVPSGQRVDLLLDFDACKSIVQTGSGKYKLKPVIKVIPYALNGIEGFIDSALFADLSTGDNNVNNVVVTAQVHGKHGEIVRSTVPNSSATPHPSRGKFFLARLTPGTYDVVITANGRATAVISGVPVPTSTSITPISTSSTAFALQNSSTQAINNGVVTLTPADDDGTVIVSAQQTLNSIPPVTVTVKSVVAAVVAGGSVGDYQFSMTLPTGAPAFAPYSAIPPPITPTSAAQSTVAKMYAFPVSAQTDTTDYTTQTPTPSPVDITTFAQPLTFSMTP